MADQGVLKMLMIVCNIVFWAMGATMLGLTIWMSVDSSVQAMSTITGLAGMNKDIYWAAVYVMMAMGCLTIIAGFIGCAGATKAPDSDPILNAYFGFNKFIILCEITVIILAAIYWDQLDPSVRTSMQFQVQNNYTRDNGTDSATKAWDNMQENWKCCGSCNYTDYEDSLYSRTYPQYRVPRTCCKKSGRDFLDCQLYSNDVNNINERGCYDKLTNVVSDNSVIIIVVTCVFVGLQLVGSICACMLIRRK